MDGDIAHCRGWGSGRTAWRLMMIDDAHSSGVLGRNGRGTVDHSVCTGAWTSSGDAFERPSACWADTYAAAAN